MFKRIQVTQGFTLIELLVVVAIIGVLSSIVLVSTSESRAKSRDAKNIQDLRQLQNALEMYFNDNGNYPQTGSVIYFNYSNISLMDNACRTQMVPFGKVAYGTWPNLFDSNFTNQYIKTLPLDTRSCFSFRVTSDLQNQTCYTSATDFVSVKDYYYFFTFEAESNLSKTNYPSFGTYNNTRRCLFGPKK